MVPRAHDVVPTEIPEPLGAGVLLDNNIANVERQIEDGNKRIEDAKLLVAHTEVNITNMETVRDMFQKLKDLES